MVFPLLTWKGLVLIAGVKVALPGEAAGALLLPAPAQLIRLVRWGLGGIVLPAAPLLFFLIPDLVDTILC